MARGTDSTTVEAPSTDGTATGESATLTPEETAKLEAKKEARKARRQLRSYVNVPMPANLKVAFETEATAADKPLGVYIRDFLASQKGIEIPVTVATRRQKYANDEERDAAKKTRREARSSLMKGLMAEFNKLVASGVPAEQATAQAAQAMAGSAS